MPSIAYKYGLLPPTKEAELCAEQMFQAHRYRNELIALARPFLQERRAMIAAHPDMAAMEERIELLRKAKPKGSEKYPELEAAYKEKTKLREQIVDTPEIKAHAGKYNEARKVVSGAYSELGLYWGTRAVANASVEQAATGINLPKFKSWAGEGWLSVQIQGGISVTELTSGNDRRAILDLTLQPVPRPPSLRDLQPNSDGSAKAPRNPFRSGRPQPRLRLRVASKERDPIFAEWPIVLHRPLPPDAVIKWVKVYRRREAAHVVWTAVFSLEVPPPVVVPAEFPAIAVNLRWKKTNVDAQSTTLAADWHDGSSAGLLTVDPAVHSQFDKGEDLESIRQLNFNRSRAAMLQCDPPIAWPEEHAEKLKTLAQWQSPSRLGQFVRWWRDHRVAGDAALFDLCDDWREQDKHLWEWRVHSRSKALLRRREAYRVFAAAAAKKYDTLVIEMLDLSELARVPESDAENGSHPVGRRQRFDTAPSELRGALVHAFRKRGRRITEVPAGMSSSEMLVYWREGRGSEKAPPRARSMKFSRLRKNKLPAST
jgi:hypothetical protein